MTDTHTENSLDEEIPEAAIAERSGLSLVWLIPVLAVLIGGWLAYKAFSETGPKITISFKTAEGLVAGKTKIKFKDVDVGEVKSIDLKDDLSGVLVTVELVPGAKKYLMDKTSFWVVRARVAAGQVTGLGTLFSGAYIGMDPVADGERTRHFIGLEVPPPVTTDVPGKRFVLHAKKLGSLDVGSPIYYRQIKVGEVMEYALEESGEKVIIDIFIYAPHDKHVFKNTRFWNASGLDARMGADGITIDTQSLVSMMLGGIAFDTPTSLDSGGPVEEGAEFWLYKNRAATHERIYTKSENYLLYFNESVRGLIPGAPVEFRGIKIGEVIDVKLDLDPEAVELRIPVLIAVEEERFNLVGENVEQLVEKFEKIQEEKGTKPFMERLVAKGFRAQLMTGNLLTGQRLVALDFHPQAKPAKVNYDGPYPQMPTVPTDIEEITAKVTSILNKINSLPIEQIGTDVQATIANLNQTVEQMEKTMTASQRLLRPDSPLQHDLRKTLQEFAEAARALRQMADYLEQHPEALIRGKEKQQ